MAQGTQRICDRLGGPARIDHVSMPVFPGKLDDAIKLFVQLGFTDEGDRQYRTWGEYHMLPGPNGSPSVQLIMSLGYDEGVLTDDVHPALVVHEINDWVDALTQWAARNGLLMAARWLDFTHVFLSFPDVLGVEIELVGLTGRARLAHRPVGVE